jgi:2-methylcitrate dehydratase PrpD
MTMTPSPSYAKKKKSSVQVDDIPRGEPSPTAQLAEFAANLEFDDIPQSTVRRTEELFLDWVGSALAGKGGDPVEAMERFALMMGPQHRGRSEVLISRRMTTPLFAAMVNAASSHFVEQDDVHTGSVFHPASVVFPSVLAAAQSQKSS